MNWERVRERIQAPEMRFAAGFPVAGGAAIQMFCEFEQRPPSRSMDARAHPLVVEALTDKDDEWRTILAFKLRISPKDTETMKSGAFIPFRNEAEHVS